MKKKKIILFSFTALMICLVAVLSCVFINSNKNELENSDFYYEIHNSENIKLKMIDRKYANEGDRAVLSMEHLVATVNEDFNNGSDSLNVIIQSSCSCCSDKVSIEFMEQNGNQFVYSVLLHEYFEHDLVICCNSVKNPEVSATVDLKCYKRICDSDGNIYFYDETVDNVEDIFTIEDDNSCTVNLVSKGSFLDYFNGYDFRLNLSPEESLGSIETINTVKYNFKLSDEFYNFISNTSEFEECYSNDNLNQNSDLSSYFENDNIIDLSEFWMATTGLSCDPLITSSLKELFNNDLYDVFGYTDDFGTLTITYENKEALNETVFYRVYLTIKFKISFEEAGIKSISIESSEIIF